jgi:hypothetical protein
MPYLDTVIAVWRQHPVEPCQIEPRFRHQSRQPFDDVEQAALRLRYDFEAKRDFTQS